MARNDDLIDMDTLESGHSQSSPNLLRVAWQRKALLAFGLVVGLVIGSLYYAQCTPIYQSGLQLLVVKKRPDVPSITGEDARYSYFDDYLSTHLVIIRSQSIVGKAVKRYDLASLRSFQGQLDPTGSIIGSLMAMRQK